MLVAAVVSDAGSKEPAYWTRTTMFCDAWPEEAVCLGHLDKSRRAHVYGQWLIQQEESVPRTS